MRILANGVCTEHRGWLRKYTGILQYVLKSQFFLNLLFRKHLVIHRDPQNRPRRYIFQIRVSYFGAKMPLHNNDEILYQWSTFSVMVSHIIVGCPDMARWWTSSTLHTYNSVRKEHREPLRKRLARRIVSSSNQNRTLYQNPSPISPRSSNAQSLMSHEHWTSLSGVSVCASSVGPISAEASAYSPER